MAEWFVRDWEDILFPWVNFLSRVLLDTYVYPYTLSAAEFIGLTGDTLFRLTDILEIAASNVLTWIENFTQKPFKFAFVSRITRNVRNWFELLQRFLEITVPIGYLKNRLSKKSDTGERVHTH